MASDTRFLSDLRQRTVFHFTPMRVSWLNQIKLWFSVLARIVLRRVNFTSAEDLQQLISAQIDSFGQILAEPFRSTDTGAPLTA